MLYRLSYLRKQTFDDAGDFQSDTRATHRNRTDDLVLTKDAL